VWRSFDPSRAPGFRGHGCGRQSHNWRSPDRQSASRYSPNHRPFRRTRKSVRPALEVESQIEPWFAPRDPKALASSSGHWSKTRRTMQKRTALRTAKHRNAPIAGQDVGLIVEAKSPKQSARTKSALDNRSHRTPIRPSRRFGMPSGNRPSITELELPTNRIVRDDINLRHEDPRAQCMRACSDGCAGLVILRPSRSHHRQSLASSKTRTPRLHPAPWDA